MSTLPPSPFLGESTQVLAVDPVVVITEPKPQFELDAALFMAAVDFPVDDPPPVFLSDPSEEYVREILRDLAPVRAATARR